MPSPIAHTSLLLAATPPLRRELDALTPTRRRLLLAWLGFALLAPDADIALGLALGYGPFGLHGGPTHSLVLAPIFGLIWAIAGRLLTGNAWPYARLVLLATAAYALHVLMDYATPGRGVALAWPLPVADQPLANLNAHRFGSPIPLYVGVEHSNPSDWVHHGWTLINELGFTLLMLCLGRGLAHLRQTPQNDAAPPFTSPAAP